MHRYDKRHWVLAACLSALAGYIDAIGFSQLGGYFVSFMSGNTTRLAVGAIEGGSAASIAGALMLLFVLGATAGALTAHVAGISRKPAVLTLVTLLLLCAATAGSAGWPHLCVGAMTLSMGAINAVFLRDGEVSIGLTYMTGTLVRLGQRLAIALTGGDRWSWLPHLMLWLGLLGGAMLGAWVFARISLDALWIAAALAGFITIGVMIFPPFQARS